MTDQTVLLIASGIVDLGAVWLLFKERKMKREIEEIRSIRAAHEAQVLQQVTAGLAQQLRADLKQIGALREDLLLQVQWHQRALLGFVLISILLIAIVPQL